MKRRSSKACREAEDERIVKGYRQTVLSADDNLDDVTKARVGARLAETIDRVAATADAAEVLVSPWRRRGVQLAAAAAAVALVVGLVLWRASRRADAPRGPQIAATPDRNRVLLPRAIVKGSGTWHEPKLVFGQKVARLEVPAGVGLRASLARRADLTLYGPLSLSVQRAEDDLIELSLERGILVGEYSGRKGTTLRIHSPQATTEVVGTLFAVEVHDGQSRVSVSHGRVRVRSANRTAAVGAKQSFSTARARLGATPPSVVALFAKHELPEAQKEPQKKEPARVVVRREARRAPRAIPPPRRVVPAPAQARVEVQEPVEEPSKLPPPQPPPRTEAPKTKKPPPPPPMPQLMPASTLYSAFEAALKRRDVKKAGQILATLIKTHPRHALADSARYELALLLIKRGDRRRAEALLNQIGLTTRLAGPAHFLRCRIKRELKQTTRAIACYASFRSAHPSSPHAYRALVALMRLSAALKDCKAVLKHTSEYLADHELGEHVGEAKRLRARCRK